MKISMTRIAFVLALVASTAGCARILGGGAPQTSATILVRNDVDPSAPLKIEIRRSNGDSETLGTVDASQERTMRFTSRELQGTYQLIGRQSSGAAVTSRDFTLFDNAQVAWQIRSNTVSVTQSR